jgi:hypothetical protein
MSISLLPVTTRPSARPTATRNSAMFPGSRLNLWLALRKQCAWVEKSGCSRAAPLIDEDSSVQPFRINRRLRNRDSQFLLVFADLQACARNDTKEFKRCAAVTAIHLDHRSRRVVSLGRLKDRNVGPHALVSARIRHGSKYHERKQTRFNANELRPARNRPRPDKQTTRAGLFFPHRL